MSILDFNTEKSIRLKGLLTTFMDIDRIFFIYVQHIILFFSRQLGRKVRDRIFDRFTLTKTFQVFQWCLTISKYQKLNKND